MEITCDELEDQFKTLLIAIGAGHVLGVKSISKKNRKVKLSYLYNQL